MSGESEADAKLRDALVGAVRATAGFLAAFETVQRRLHPPRIPELRGGLARFAEALDDARDALRDARCPSELEGLHTIVRRAADAAAAAAQAFLVPGPEAMAAPRILESFRLGARAHESLYPLRFVFPALGRLYAEPPLHDALDALDPTPPDGVSVGFHRAGAADDPDARGGFVLYVPERYDGREALPLVVALHGAFGHGRDFLWSWLREARSRRVLLLAPTSRGTTWSLDEPARDTAVLLSMLDFVRGRWKVDPARILLTGLSDGGTFALLAGLAEDAPWTHLAPAAGVLHPMSFRSGNLERARGRKIYLVHGALDWMFPVSVARIARDELVRAGADLVYREIEDLSHTTPRDEHAAILRWMDPALALPGEA